jgi:hypothetical protein
MPPWFGHVRPGPCRAIGGTDTLVRTFSVTSYSAVACIRRPAPNAERLVRAMFDSTRFPEPPY